MVGSRLPPRIIVPRTVWQEKWVITEHEKSSSHLQLLTVLKADYLIPAIAYENTIKILLFHAVTKCAACAIHKRPEKRRNMQTCLLFKSHHTSTTEMKENSRKLQARLTHFTIREIALNALKRLSECEWRFPGHSRQKSRKSCREFKDRNDKTEDLQSCKSFQEQIIWRSLPVFW